ncbi:NAD-dependent DNA ligase LigA [Roseburia faecis]|uniref:NAD-dependent DNA ligase LigA n=1 Tax=Roseburia faecis TaxID=301302 RepID=UPI0031B5E7A5
MENKFEIKEMRECIDTLNKASAAYYNGGNTIMSDQEWDAMFDRLKKMEEETGIVYPDSPTHSVGAPVKVDELQIVKHEFPALSLDKTKDIQEFPEIFKKRAAGMAVVMWKLDGGTIVLTYDNGELIRAATRGNGEVGSDITHNAPYIKGIPMKIPYKGHLVTRGEAVMSYGEFERINSGIVNEEDQYANPRNLANATIIMQDSAEMKDRKIQFFAFKLVYMDDPLPESQDTFMGRLNYLDSLGFDTVYRLYGDSQSDLIDVMNGFSDAVPQFEYPVDGLVVASDDVRYAEKLPETGRHPNPLVGYALKWKDEEVKTTLTEIEWSPSRTGRINPVAVFDPVHLEGTEVTRASLHNVSILKEKRLRVGDSITVFKANKIIPQIAKNLTPGSKLTYAESHPVYCPCCGQETEPRITCKDGRTVEVAMCMNPECPAKHVKKFVHFVERDCMNIKGLSEATLQKFIERGFIREFADLYHLDRYKEQIVEMEGFGQKSYDKLIAAVEASRKVTFVPFIHALGIPNIGKGQAKLFNKEYSGDVKKFFLDVFQRHDFTHIEGIGEVLNDNLWRWGNEYLRYIPFEDYSNRIWPLLNLEIYNLLKEVEIQVPEKVSTAAVSLNGKTFVITGKLNHFVNRDALVAKIEELGGKSSGSVSKNTSYLINNDVESTSGKNKKAKELNVPIISEDDFLKMFNYHVD